MHILVTGGTGLIGRGLCSALLSQGHRVTVLSRRAARVEACFGSSVTHWQDWSSWSPEVTIDAVINLAGEPIADRPWTVARRTTLRTSRVDLTAGLVKVMAQATQPPRILLSGSAVGYYGYDDEAVFDEDQPMGEGFSAQLCGDWEKAAQVAQALGARVVLMRTGLILSRSGGLLPRINPTNALGLSFVMGSGNQWMSWIHREDYVRMVLMLLHDDGAQGAFNMTAPYPVRAKEFMAQVAQIHRHWGQWTIPEGWVRTLWGARAELLLEGQRVVPQRALKRSFEFRFPRLEGALQALTQE